VVALGEPGTPVVCWPLAFPTVSRKAVKTITN